jgi:RimJ/RimL family protein N-acetyltransferase
MFEGKKVKLRSLELTDLDEIMLHWNDIPLRKELGPVIPHFRQERKEWIERTWRNRQTGKEYTFAIEELSSKKLLGHCSLNNVRPINRTAKVSIAIYSEDNRGRGYGTDALQVLLEVGFNYLNLHRIGLNVFESNTRAIHVYEKIGFTKVGVLRHTDFVQGRYVNDVAMDILDYEWREGRKKEKNE